MPFPLVTLQLPAWIDAFLPDPTRRYPTAEERMRLVIDLAREHIRRGTGGPFAAAIFNAEDQTLLAPGVNLVVPAGCSVAHAEMVAIMVAQQVAGTFDLAGAGLPPCELVTSTEPWAMCLGAVPWSGVRSVVCGARDEDARAVGFDEGSKPLDWPAALAERGIAVRRDVCRDEAAQVLRDYAAGGNLIYNGRNPGD
jgi:tRNA(Arg) A34 adenosine deaminase TadA